MSYVNNTDDYVENAVTGNVTRHDSFIEATTKDSQNDSYDDYSYFDDYYGSQYDYNGSYPYFEHKVFRYAGFDFERPIYQFIWEILVIFTTLFNVVVIIVLLRKNMRSVIHTVLVAIAISDSMTGLVTLPTYIYTYSHYKPGGVRLIPGYVLDKYWCNAFMISKFFLSKWFHNVSIWLTLFLGAQRFVSVIFPFKTQKLFTIQNTLIFIGTIFILSPVLHTYHLIYPKADVKTGYCNWTLDDDWSLVYLWATLLLMHLIPCILLVVLSILMIYRLFSSTSQLTRAEGSSASMIERRHIWNRRMSIIVTTIVIGLLIPEIPYGIFLFLSVIKIHSKDRLLPLHDNRAFHAVYEILLVLSFHANFWIYTILNKRFRSEMKKTFREIRNSVCKLVGKPPRTFSITSTSFTGGKTADSYVTGRTGMKLKDLGASSTSDSKSERNPLKNPSSETAEKQEQV